MALAPRISNPETGATRDSGLGTEGKRQQRKRNANSPTKSLTNSGSSGAAKGVSQYPKVNWEDIQADVVHLCDVAAKTTHAQIGKDWLTLSLGVPQEYAHDMMDAHLASQQGMLYLKVFYVPLSAFLPDEPDDTDDTDDNAGDPNGS